VREEWSGRVQIMIKDGFDDTKQMIYETVWATALMSERLLSYLEVVQEERVEDRLPVTPVC